MTEPRVYDTVAALISSPCPLCGMAQMTRANFASAVAIAALLLGWT